MPRPSSPNPAPAQVPAGASAAADGGGVALQAEEVVCERGERALFAPLSFSMAGGELVWLRGRNGFGKTTLLRTLAGLGQPAAGQVRYHGRRAAGADRLAARRGLVHIGHANALKEDLTVAEALAFLARLDGWPAGAREREVALDRLGVASLRGRAVRTLSQGQRRRCALARLALAPARSTWLLDEPFDALDAEGTQRLAALLDEHAAAGGCALFTSHLPPPSLSAPLRVLDLAEAALPVRTGPPASVGAVPGSPP